MLGVMLTPDENGKQLYAALLDGEDFSEYQRSYSGPIGDSPVWALNIGLDQIRYRLNMRKETENAS